MLFVLTPAVHGVSNNSGARFLKLGVGARELAMGTAATALTRGINAVYWNPAGLNRMSQSELGITHAEWLVDTRYDFVGFARPSSKGTWAISGTHLGHGQQEGRDENRQKTGSFEASDLAVGLAFAWNLNRRLGLGTHLKFIESRIAGDRAQAIALDAGTQYALGGRNSPRLGLSVRNLGTTLKFINQKDSLPLTFAAGISQPLLLGLLLSGEWQYDQPDKKHQLVMGAEYQVFSLIAIRGGYLAPLASTQFIGGSGTDNLAGFVGGMGLDLLNYKFDYAFKPVDVLGETHRFSFSVSF